MSNPHLIIPKIEPLFGCAFNWCSTDVSYPAKHFYLIPRTALDDSILETDVSNHYETSARIWICDQCCGYLNNEIFEDWENYEWSKEPNLQDHLEQVGMDGLRI